MSYLEFSVKTEVTYFEDCRLEDHSYSKLDRRHTCDFVAQLYHATKSRNTACRATV